MSDSAISDEQAHALFNYLTHVQALHEFTSLKVPGRVSSSGPPFARTSGLPAQAPSPLLNTLFRRLALTLPGLRDAAPALWRAHAQGLLELMAAQDLSDSFDKGVISKRKTVGFAVVVVAEYAARGVLGGLPRRRKGKVPEREAYDLNNAKDVSQAWESVQEGLVYGDDMEQLLEWAIKTDQLSDLPPRYQAAHQHAAITFATFLHYLLTLNPAGPTVRRLLQRVHALLPWGTLRQTLKVGNAASMVGAVVRVVLYRAPTLSGLFGKGTRRQNFMQSIISSVLGADKNALEVKIAALSSSDTCGTPAQIAALESYVGSATRQDRLDARYTAQHTPTSLVTVICEQAGADIPESQAVHDALQERLALLLAVRDRERIIGVLCQAPGSASPSPSGAATPASEDDSAVGAATDDDPLSAAVREAVRAFEPILRAVHAASDLPAALGSLQAFLDALLALPARAGAQAYVRVVRDHQASLHRFLHGVAQSAELRAAYRRWYDACLGAYRRAEQEDAGRLGAGAMQRELAQLVSSLSADERAGVLADADAWAAWLASLDAHSEQRRDALMAALAASSASSPDGDDEMEPVPAGPGAWQAVWQALVDATAVTPARAGGPVRFGADGAVQAASAHDRAEEHGAPSPSPSRRSFGSRASVDSSRSGAGGRQRASAGEKLGLGEVPRPEMEATQRAGVREKWEEVLIRVCMPGSAAA